jgi:protein subunit release factor B
MEPNLPPLPVSPAKVKFLSEKMKSLGVTELDWEESFVLSSGKGGQNVNKVSTAVRLRHKTSGIEVKFSEYRTQGLNRYGARKSLLEKLEFALKPEASPRLKMIKKAIRSKKDKLRKFKKKLESQKEKDSREDQF